MKIERSWLLLSLLAACGNDGNIARPGPTAIPQLASDGGTPPSDSGSGSVADASANARGLPCEVGSLLRARCASCHGNPPASGVPFGLLSHAELTAAFSSSETRAQRALIAMESGMMPPGAPLSAAEITPFRAWVQGGTPQGTCGEVDAGAVTPAPTTCTSGELRTKGDDDKERMRPGQPCVACHGMRLSSEQPRFALAGTVYPMLHERNDCEGVDLEGEVQVVITGADNRVLTLEPNDVGNFYSTQMVAMPFRAELRYQGRVRRMMTPQISGDCNGCHTEQGTNGAPGRILLP